MSGEGFLTKNISGLTRALESIVVADDMSRAPGWLQGLDPRVKVASFLMFVIIVALTGSLLVMAQMFALALVVTRLSRVPLSFFLKRILLFIPVFTLVIAIPALFVTPGRPLVHLIGNIVITEQGARTAELLVLRVTDSLSFAVLLILTTPWAKLLVALRWFRLPSLIVAIVGMTYSYIFLLLHTANSMFMSRRSRTIGSFSGSENRRWLAQALTVTMAKSQYLSEEVYLAMLSRGYQGEVRTLDNLSMRRRDFFALAGAVAVALIILWVNYR